MIQGNTSGVHGFDVNPTTEGTTLLGPESAYTQLQLSSDIQTYTLKHE